MNILQHKAANSKRAAGNLLFSLTSLVASTLPIEMNPGQISRDCATPGFVQGEALPFNIQLPLKFYIIHVISGHLLPIKRVWFVSISLKDLFHQKTLDFGFLDLSEFSPVVLVTPGETVMGVSHEV